MVVAALVAAPVLIAATSPLLASRDAAYIIGGMAGVLALALFFMQPLLAAGYLPGIALTRERRWHRVLGAGLVILVLMHVGGLYIASPQDMTDALLLVAPTPFSVYGVIGFWGVVATAVFVAARARLRIRPATWNIFHNTLALIMVSASVTHALMIEGAMGARSKLLLCLCVLAATALVILHLRVLKPLLRNR